MTLAEREVIPSERAVVESTQDYLLPSAYMRYLPALYWKDPFLGRFLRIFEDVLSPVQRNVNSLPDQFDPAVSSSPMLDLLAEWVGEVRPDALSERSFRKMVKNALLLHQWRGTKRGVRLAVEIVLGQKARITEYSPGLVLGSDSSLGLNTSLQQGSAMMFNVALDCDSADVDIAILHATIRRHKPAHVLYTVSFRE
jgi:phage tail-like protein